MYYPCNKPTYLLFILINRDKIGTISLGGCICNSCCTHKQRSHNKDIKHRKCHVECR